MVRPIQFVCFGLILQYGLSIETARAQEPAVRVTANEVTEDDVFQIVPRYPVDRRKKKTESRAGGQRGILEHLYEPVVSAETNQAFLNELVQTSDVRRASVFDLSISAPHASAIRGTEKNRYP